MGFFRDFAINFSEGLRRTRERNIASIREAGYGDSCRNCEYYYSGHDYCMYNDVTVYDTYVCDCFSEDDDDE